MHKVYRLKTFVQNQAIPCLFRTDENPNFGLYLQEKSPIQTLLLIDNESGPLFAECFPLSSEEIVNAQDLEIAALSDSMPPISSDEPISDGVTRGCWTIIMNHKSQKAYLQQSGPYHDRNRPQATIAVIVSLAFPQKHQIFLARSRFSRGFLDLEAKRRWTVGEQTFLRDLCGLKYYQWEVFVGSVKEYISYYVCPPLHEVVCAYFVELPLENWHTLFVYFQQLVALRRNLPISGL
jgi:hypothetical protein